MIRPRPASRLTKLSPQDRVVVRQAVGSAVGADPTATELRPTPALGKVADWIKANPVYGVIVLLVPLVGLLSSLSGAMGFINIALNRPSCWRYYSVYYHSIGHFRDVGKDNWIEFQSGVKYEFKEFSRSRDFIVLQNKSERPGNRDWANWQVRIPVCDGMAQLSMGWSQPWRNLAQVTHRVSDEVAAEQQKYETP